MLRSNYNFNHLKYFYYTVTEGGVSQAAKKLNIQQPVVSKMIGQLEYDFEEALFIKQGRQKILSDFGQLIFRHCQIIFKELDKLDNLRVGEEEISGLFNIGASEPIAQKILPKVIINLKDKFPKVHCNVFSSTVSQIVQMLKIRKLDLGLVFYLPEIPDEVEVLEKIPTQFRFVVSKAFRRNKKTLNNFIGSREIDDNKTHEFPTLDKLRSKYPEASIRFSSNHIGLHKELVLSGSGVAIMPDYLIRSELNDGQVVDVLKNEKFIFDLLILGRRGLIQNQLTKEAIDLISSKVGTC